MAAVAQQAPGLEAVYKTCREVYPSQPNPLQIAAVVKYWSVSLVAHMHCTSCCCCCCRLGGPDPLDFINVYCNEGDAGNGIPAHWHYVSCGLSDLYGDGRVHE